MSNVPVMTLQHRLPGELGADWETTWEIKNVLRESLAMWSSVGVDSRPKRALRNNCAHSDRATGKTTALVQFIAERHLVVHPDKKVGVIVPNTQVGKLFERQFKEQFPTVRLPLLFVVGDNDQQAISQVQGSEVEEVYAEEMFMMRFRTIDMLEQMGVFVCGVGTLKRPAGVRINSW